MFLKNSTLRKTRNKGFSLIEILIAVAILALITIPLAMNFIASSQINSKSKSVGTASDMTTSIIESMQTISLSDIMIDANGYNMDEYGSNIGYTITDNVLSNYEIRQVFEAKTDKNAEMNYPNGVSYLPCSKQVTKAADGTDIVLWDYEVNGSVNLRQTTAANLYKAYFTGQDNNRYSIVYGDVRSDDAAYDITIDIEPSQEFEMVDIDSFKQTDSVIASQDFDAEKLIAAQFELRNKEYARTINDPSKYVARNAEWFLDNMTKKIDVTISTATSKTNDLGLSDINESFSVLITCTYEAPKGSVDDDYLKVINTLASFSTNATAEFIDDIYVYYTPLLNASDGKVRDYFEVFNYNEVKADIYFIASSEKDTIESINKDNYNPSITINELTAFRNPEPVSNICSNIPDECWGKTLQIATGDPDTRNLTIKSLGNVSKKQTLYKMKINIYSHNKAMWNATTGAFTPDDKYLLTSTEGSFLDNSEKQKIDTAKSTGKIDHTTHAEAAAARTEEGKFFVYTGNSIVGVVGSNVVWSGTTEAVNVGDYVAYAVPSPGYSWPDGSFDKKTITWSILPAPVTRILTKNYPYTRQLIKGIPDGALISDWDSIKNGGSDLYGLKWTGQIEGKDVGSYIAYCTPDENHCWTHDNSRDTLKFVWNITKRELNPVWGKDTWVYDGNVHVGTCTAGGLLPGDTCEIVLANNEIINVGKVKAKIVGLSNPNYALPNNPNLINHDLTVTEAVNAKVVITDKVYNGTLQTGIDKAEGVIINGQITGTNVKKDGYTILVTLKEGYKWDPAMKVKDANGVERAIRDDEKSITLTWNIIPITAELEWGIDEWEWDGLEHKTTCEIKNLVAGTTCDVILENNSITDAGTKTVKIKKLSNDNYILKKTEVLTHNITVKRAPTAYCRTLPYVDRGEEEYQYKAGLVRNGADYEFCDLTGIWEAENAGQYTFYAVPDKNHYWADVSATASEEKKTEKRTFVWRIFPTLDAYVEGRTITFAGPQYDYFGVAYEYAEKAAALDGKENLNIDVVYSHQVTATTCKDYHSYAQPLPNHGWIDLCPNHPDKDKFDSRNWECLTEVRRVDWAIKPMSEDLPTFIGFDTPADKFITTYTGEIIQPEIMVNDISLFDMPEEELKERYGLFITGDREAREAGKYKVTIGLVDQEHNQWADGSTADVTLDWEILKRPIGIKEASANSKTYDGTTYTVTNEIIYWPSNQFKSFGTLNGTPHTYSFVHPTTPDYIAGEYTLPLTIVIKDKNNQDVTHNYNVEMIPSKVTIKKRAIKVQSEGKTWNYDGVTKSNPIHKIISTTKLASYDVQEVQMLTTINEVGTKKNEINSFIIKKTNDNNRIVTSSYDISYDIQNLVIKPRVATMDVKWTRTNNGTPVTSVKACNHEIWTATVTYVYTHEDGTVRNITENITFTAFSPNTDIAQFSSANCVRTAKLTPNSNDSKGSSLRQGGAGTLNVVLTNTNKNYVGSSSSTDPASLNKIIPVNIYSHAAKSLTEFYSADGVSFESDFNVITNYKNNHGRELSKTYTYNASSHCYVTNHNYQCQFCNAEIANTLHGVNTISHNSSGSRNDAVTATCASIGYTNTLYCTQCNVNRGGHEEIPIKSTHDGGFSIVNRGSNSHQSKCQKCSKILETINHSDNHQSVGGSVGCGQMRTAGCAHRKYCHDGRYTGKCTSEGYQGNTYGVSYIGSSGSTHGIKFGCGESMSDSHHVHKTNSDIAGGERNHCCICNHDDVR